MTVLEAIQKSTEFLAKKGVDSPRLQTELLLAHALKLPRMKLYLNFERALAPADVDALRELIKRRSQREPLQHITGSTSFCGFEIAVNRHVLIPRPETELLAELGWQFLNRPAQESERRAPSRPEPSDRPCLAETVLGVPIASVFIRVHPWLKNKKPTAVWQWVDKFRERIKTRLPRWSAARS